MKRSGVLSVHGLQGKMALLLGGVILLPFLNSGLAVVTLDRHQMVHLFFGMAGAFLGVALAVVFQRQVYRPLRDLCRVGSRLAAGLDGELPIRSGAKPARYPDEIRALERVIVELGSSVRTGTREVIQRVKVLSLLDQLDRTLCETLDRYEVFQALAIEAVRVLSYDRLVLIVGEEEHDRIEVLEFEPTTLSHPKTYFLPLDDYFRGDHFRLMGPILHHDRSAFDNIPEYAFLAKKEVHSCVVFPLRSAPGLLCFCSRAPGHFSEKEVDLIEPLARKISTALEIIRLFEATRLTGRTFPAG
ncbi:MAG: GAF domain-containing protein [Nitrospirae bacterium]|nr:GAF domain-containing protein [Nitrospirota bacterium]